MINTEARDWQSVATGCGRCCTSNSIIETAAVINTEARDWQSVATGCGRDVVPLTAS